MVSCSESQKEFKMMCSLDVFFVTATSLRVHVCVRVKVHVCVDIVYLLQH